MNSFYTSFGKRAFDLIAAVLGLALTWWIIILAILIATVSTRSFGLFTQKRIGRHGQPFMVLKVKTMRSIHGVTTSVTTSSDVRLTKAGKIMRRLKIDELPQLINVLFGQMSFVGPRPDVPGWADKLQGKDREILSLRPGITGPATLEFRDEESLLATVTDPEAYNQNVIFPRKVALNLSYACNMTFKDDVGYILETISPTLRKTIK